MNPAASLQDILARLLSIEGVLAGRLLSPAERREILRLENVYSRTLLKGFGRPVNIGVRECMTRSYVVGLVTGSGFKWPPGPYALIMVNEVIVGEISNGIKIAVAKLARARGSRNSWKLIFPPLRFPPLEGLARNPVMASPSPPSDKYLKKILGAADDHEIGTAIIGFNL